jgi:hypothetical protein
LLAAACGGRGTPVPFVDITRELRGFEPPRLARETFTSRAELADYLRHAMPGRHLAVPSVDWRQREAILVASGPRSSTGYALRVASIFERGDRIVLTVRERTPALGEPVRARLTYPYVLITIPRTDKRLLLHFRGRP